MGWFSDLKIDQTAACGPEPLFASLLGVGHLESSI